MRFNVLLEKYTFLKTFGNSMKYEDYPMDEINALLYLDSTIKEVEVRCQEMNQKHGRTNN
ncbi:MAG: hypothetical protein Unbinned1693contig1002_45 [Prokaryotic dsDNA virus sp.]|jgi:hypothetical protein|nr:MAG: hypothetical protein Unbinned1693contig1002_45 [Prokaryotic dsDNA virus sp.]